MLSFYNRAELSTALTLPLRTDIQTLLRARIRHLFETSLAYHTHLVVVFADDTEAALIQEVAFSPLEADGHRYGSPGFTPRWDVLHDHGGWFEMVFCIGNEGWAVVLLIEEAKDCRFSELQAACRDSRQAEN